MKKYVIAMILGWIASLILVLLISVDVGVLWVCFVFGILSGVVALWRTGIIFTASLVPGTVIFWLVLSLENFDLLSLLLMAGILFGLSFFVVATLGLGVAAFARLIINKILAAKNKTPAG